MKKICLLGMSLVTTFAAMAQADVVKEVEHTLKGAKPDYSKALKEIQPALTNPETANTVMPWYLAGKAAFGVFDDVFAAIQTGNDVSPEQKKAAGLAYVNGFNYYMKALPLDSLPDEKGKIKPKKSKEILNTLKGAHTYLNYAAGFLFDSRDYDDAYRALDLFVTAPSNPILAKNPPVELADTIRGQMLLAEAQALLLSNEANPDSLKAVKAIEVLDAINGTGFESDNIYNFGLIAARSIGDKEAKTRFAKAGYDKYGTSNIQFIGELINDRLDKEDYAGASEYVRTAENATAADNTSMLSQLANIQGAICERSNDLDGAYNAYTKALQLNPESYDSMYRLASVMLMKVDKQTSEDENLSALNFKDDLLKAADLLEKAYNHDDIAYSGIPYQLYTIYYLLGNDYVDQAKYWEQLK